MNCDRLSSFEQDAEDVGGLLEHLQIAQVDLLGQSRAGVAAKLIAIRYPQPACRSDLDFNKHCDDETAVELDAARIRAGHSA